MGTASGCGIGGGVQAYLFPARVARVARAVVGEAVFGAEDCHQGRANVFRNAFSSRIAVPRLNPTPATVIQRPILNRTLRVAAGTVPDVPSDLGVSQGNR